MLVLSWGRGNWVEAEKDRITRDFFNVVREVTRMWWNLLDLTPPNVEVRITRNMDPDADAHTNFGWVGRPSIDIPVGRTASLYTFGLTLAHELFHVKQGKWAVWKSYLIWALDRFQDMPTVEQEAYEWSVNKWTDWLVRRRLDWTKNDG